MADSAKTYNQKIELAKKAIIKKRYTSAVVHLNSVLQQLKRIQIEHIEMFFPAKFQTFNRDEPEEDLNDMVSQHSESGVLYSSQYHNKTGGVLEINIVHRDPSISEFKTLVRNPHMAKNLDNTDVIKVNEKYYALEKYSEEDKYIERNIILNNETMLNFIVNGIEGRSFLDEICQKIDLKKKIQIFFLKLFLYFY